jgi:hypothetical protein
MASEFDESLLGFLQAHLGMFMQFHEHKGEFHVDLGFEGSAGPEGVGSGATLDDAINAAVEDFEQRSGMARNAPDDLEPNRVWTTKYKNSLPDTAFLYVRKDCVEYKEAGRSHPLDCRDLPVKNRSGAYDYAHVKNAISRAIQLEGVPMSVQKKLQAKARAIFKREFGYESED